MSNQEGENSRRDSRNDDEKPLKKAKYMWQVKGKQHLRKNANTDEPLMDNSSSTTSDLEPVTSTSNSDEDHRSLENNNKNPEFSKKCTFIQAAPRTQARIPIPQPNYLSRWEAKQMARCLLDNTINSLLDNFRNQPTNGDSLMNNHNFEGFDFDSHDYVCETCNNDGQIEDDAILMAIQSHGLRGSANDEHLGIVESTKDNIDNMQAELKQNSWDIGIHEEMIHDSLDFLDAAVTVAIQEKGLSYGY